MSETLARVKDLVVRAQVRVSDHGDEELEADRLSAREVFAGLAEAVIVEDYADSGRGPSVLVLERDSQNQPIHVVWGISYNRGPAVLVTAYRPDPQQWSSDFTRRLR